jgi:drug/metabolite transporter (DMT)-like permease
MNATRVAGLVLIVAGVLALAYGGFGFTRQTHQTQLGPIQLSVSERQDVRIPLWAGVAAIAAGGLLLALGGKRR